MDVVDVCKLMVERDGACVGVDCYDCPVYKYKNRICHASFANAEERLPWLRQWLESHGGNMDREAAIKRLVEIEEEAKKLREIIEKGDKIVYDSTKIYVGLDSGKPYILAGYDDADYFRFHSFGSYNRTEQGYSAPIEDPQDCLDYHVNDGFDIHVFGDPKEALQFFIDHL